MPARFIAVSRAAYIQTYMTSDHATSATIGASSGLGCMTEPPPFGSSEGAAVRYAWQSKAHRLYGGGDANFRRTAEAQRRADRRGRGGHRPRILRLRHVRVLRDADRPRALSGRCLAFLALFAGDIRRRLSYSPARRPADRQDGRQEGPKARDDPVVHHDGPGDDRP